MSSKVQICNLALSRVAVSSFIGNIETERSKEAIVCNRWYDHCRRVVLQDFDWGFARRREALALTGGTAPTHWLYEYVYPNLCLSVRSLVHPSTPTPRKDQKIPYEIGNDGTQRVIYTDLEDAEVVYTVDVTNANLFPPLFENALSALIASEIAIPLTIKPDMIAQARQAYLQFKDQAMRADANEGETGSEPDSEYIAYRNA